jgi:hypothetical protein
MIKRRSKIAKLPKDIQLQLNTMLDEGATYQSIVDWLATKGFHDFTIDTVYQWKEGGFQDWLRQQQRIDRANALLQWGTQVTNDNAGVQPASAIVLFGSAQLQGLLDEIDTLETRGSFAEQPEVYARCFNALARFARIAFDIQKHQDLIRIQADKTSHASEPSDKPAAKTITEQSLGHIEDRLNLM